MPILKKKFKNILIIRTDRIGDFLLNIPLILNLKKIFPDSKITALISKHIEQLQKNLLFIDEFILYDEKYSSIFGKLKLINLLASKKFDLVIISNPNKIFNWIACLSGIPVRIGYHRKSGFLLTHKIKDNKHQNLKHEIEYNLDLLKPINLQPQIIDPFLLIHKEDRYKIDILLKSRGINNQKPLIIIQSQSSNPSKCWAKNNFAITCDNLISDLDAQIIFIGSLEEKEDINEILSLMKNKAINLAGLLKLNELAALLKKADLLISNDSGPMHIATFVQTPVIAIFGKYKNAASPIRWGPWGKDNKIIHDDLELITPKQIIETTRKSLKKYNYA
ncbi:MAG: glycosyltransferase family 9 protein [Patescibacteria group bacterium]